MAGTTALKNKRCVVYSTDHMATHAGYMETARVATTILRLLLVFAYSSGDSRSPNKIVAKLFTLPDKCAIVILTFF